MAEAHDAGGKVRLPLLPGVHGSAEFAGDRDEHRLWLLRTWGAGPYLLSVGMNPSTAEASVDDLTLRKDQEFAKRAGFQAVYKVNIGSYRCTDPAQLPRRTELVHPANVPTIRRLAAGAGLVLLVTGEPPELLMGHARTLFNALRADGIAMNCLGTTKSGWPKHSSRLAYSTPIVRFSW